MTQSITQSIRVSAIDDHTLFLQGLRRALGHASDIVFVSEGANSAEACRIAVDDSPDVLLLDLNIPGDGIAAARLITSLAPNVKIIIVTGSSEDEDVTSALSVGAKGYLLKGAGAAEVIDAVRAVYSGRPYVTHELASRLIVQTIGRRIPAQTGASGKLNDRERQIIGHATAGLTNREIAQRLGLPVSTVRNYMSNILKKCGVRNRLQAVLALESSFNDSASKDRPDTL